ncbi:hypothetical protein [Arthrobacter sp. Soil736]|uniref:hypothetical protein n=1 Tax=Arthrobacter sp. Soil736 TaxID=1736395 RepID=UPI0009E6690F|nr:hypothetical protein [Arthrobacter sp. Soil736]
MPRPPDDGVGPAESLPRDEADEQDETVSHSDVSQTPEEVLAYWTPERMAQAKPREIRFPEADADPEADGQPQDN